jgi:hypothetical protein
VNQVPVGEILDIILSADLATVLRPDCVFITTRGVGMQNFSLVIYPIADLLLSNDPKNNYDWQDLLDVLKRNVNYMADHSVASWTDEGGPAVVDFLGGALVVTQTPRGQERVMEFLAMLRKARAQDGSYAPVFMPGAAGAKHIRRRLAERVDVDFENTTLSAALGFLQEALKGVNLVVDPDLAAQGIDLTLRAITLKWKQTPINEVLTKVLGPDLGYRVYPQYVLVSTRDRLQQNLPTVMYPIRDLLVERRLPREGSELGEADRQRQTIGGSADSGDSGQFFVRDAPREIDLDVWWQELVDIIKRNFNNFDDRNVAAWTDEGGPAAIDYYYGGVLIVTQTPRAHERIAELLSLLREAMTCVERQLQ